MTFALTAALILTVLAFVVLLDRKDKRAHARQERHDKQVERLCQRIQAPELAVAHHDAEQAPDSPPGAPPLDPENDEQWEQQREAMAQMESLGQAMASFGMRE